MTDTGKAVAEALANLAAMVLIVASIYHNAPAYIVGSFYLLTLVSGLILLLANQPVNDLPELKPFRLFHSACLLACGAYALFNGAPMVGGLVLMAMAVSIGVRFVSREEN